MEHPLAKLSPLLLLCFFMQMNSQVNLNQGLTACYNLNGNANEAVNNLTGTLNAVSAAADHKNTTAGAIAFTGSASSYAELPAHALIQPTAELSCSVWLRIDQFKVNDHIIFTKNDSYNYFAAYNLLIHNIGGTYFFRSYKESSADGTSYVQSTTTVALNTWYHVVFTMDNSLLTIYVNGVHENTATAIPSFAYDPSGKPVILGGTNETHYNTPMTGAISDLRFYNRILTAAEAAALYAQDPECVMETVGVNDQHKEKTISVYPTSTARTVFIEGPSGFRYTVTNGLGQVLQTGEVSGDKAEFDLSDYSSGLYYLKIDDGENTTVRKVIRR